MLLFRQELIVQGTGDLEYSEHPVFVVQSAHHFKCFCGVCDPMQSFRENTTIKVLSMDSLNSAMKLPLNRSEKKVSYIYFAATKLLGQYV